MVAILRGNTYSEHLMTMFGIENMEDYHIELNLDQWLDQRTYNVPITLEVAAIWIKDGSIHGIRSYHGCYMVNLFLINYLLL